MSRSLVSTPESSPYAAVRRPCLAVAVAAVALLLITAGALGAQEQRHAPDPRVATGTITLTGTVRDTAGAPIVGAEIRATLVHFAMTDRSGSFTLRGVPFDTLNVLVRHIGHTPVSRRIAAPAPGMRVDLEFTLLPRVTQLGTVMVEGQGFSRQLVDVGFYDRQRRGWGRSFGPEFMEHFGGASIGSLVRETPRLYVDVESGNREYAYSRIGGKRCRMNVFVDGVFQRAGMAYGGHRGLSLSEFVPREQIVAVEIYPSPNFVPSEFRRIGAKAGTPPRSNTSIPPPNHARSRAQNVPEHNDAECGAIVIWTKMFAGLTPASAPVTRRASRDSAGAAGRVPDR